MPGDRTDVVTKLAAHDLRRGVGGVGPTPRDARDHDVLRALEPEAVKGHAEVAGNRLDGRTLLGLGVDCIDDDRAPGAQRGSGAAQKFGVDPPTRCRAVALRRQVAQLRDPGERLAQHVTAQVQRPRRRAEVRRQLARQAGLAGAREPAHCHQARRCRLQIGARGAEVGPGFVVERLVGQGVGLAVGHADADLGAHRGAHREEQGQGREVGDLRLVL